MEIRKLNNFLIGEEIEFDAAHRIVSTFASAECSLHGHTWKIRVEMSTENGEHCFVIRNNFSKLSDWVYEELDHSVMVAEFDTPLLEFCQIYKQRHRVFKGNTTAEGVAREIYEKCFELFQFYPDKILVSEDGRSYGEYTTLPEYIDNFDGLMN